MRRLINQFTSQLTDALIVGANAQLNAPKKDFIYVLGNFNEYAKDTNS